MFFLRTLAVEMLAAGIILIPLFFILRRVCFRNTGRVLANLLPAFCIAGLCLVSGLPSVEYIRFGARFQLMSLSELLVYRKFTALHAAFFVPLGFLLPLLYRDCRRLHRTVLIGFLVALAIELLQIFTYREVAVNDLLTGVVGTVIGFLAAQPVRLLPFVKPGGKKQELYAALVLPFLVMFFIQPPVAALFWKILY